MKKNYGYIRLNENHILPEGFSLEEQSAIITDYADSHKFELEQTIQEEEHLSSTSLLPQMQELLQKVEQGEVKRIIIARLDRVTRSIREYYKFLELIKKHKVSLISVEEGISSNTKSGKIALDALAIAGKWDMKHFSDRTWEIVQKKRAIGERVGHAPFGFVYKNKKLVPSPAEHEAVLVIHQKRKEGLSYRKIAECLNQQKIPAKRGGNWYAETIKSVCKKAIYVEIVAAAESAQNSEN